VTRTIHVLRRQAPPSQHPFNANIFWPIRASTYLKDSQTFKEQLQRRPWDAPQVQPPLVDRERVINILKWPFFKKEICVWLQEVLLRGGKKTAACMLFPIKKKKEMKEKFKCQVKEARVPASSCSARQVIPITSCYQSWSVNWAR
jgi:hypothetical protein